MGVRLTSQDAVALYCSTTGLAFGPVFDSEDEAHSFITWYQAEHGDPRAIVFAGTAGHHAFMQRYQEWHRTTHDELTSEFAQEIADGLIKELSR